jgi:hypothetical protein
LESAKIEIFKAGKAKFQLPPYLDLGFELNESRQ